MLPPGHIAAGYLTAKAYITLAHPNITVAQSHALLWLGALFGFIPDVDMFLAFFKLRSLTIQSEKVDHRVFLTHVPWLWLIAGLFVSLCGKVIGNSFVESIGMILWLGTWSHFILDSFYWGLRWLWPFSQKCYAWFPLRPGALPNNNKKFFNYWFVFIQNYFIEQPVTAYLEIVLLLGAVSVLIIK